MNIPKPQPPKKAMTPIASPPKETNKIGAQIAEEKREFVLKPHLTQRPFRGPDMAALRKTLEGGR